MSKVVIVTGGSRGIGAATSLLLGAKGYAVCVNYLTNQERAREVVDSIIRGGGRAFAYQADVSKEADVIRLFDAAEAHFGSVTHLVNNAGILFTQSRFVDIDFERFKQVMGSNVDSCFLCCREAIRRFGQGSAIVNVSSRASQTGSPFEYVDYAVSKGGMDTLTKGLSLEVAALGIRVNAVRPGSIYTDMHADGGEPGRVDRLAPQIPMQRGGTAEEVANSIAWLLSEEASYVTGSFIDVAGGR
ncbi:MULTISPECIES: SDR family oxidoreductase [unclassified Halomonas]|uniref:SDR family oxidoreductase n=1 Tax=unclassified Halomonas TaxID=2609666 RepID=UPI004033F02B